MRGMQSVEQEAITFPSSINTATAKGSVEIWLLQVSLPIGLGGSYPAVSHTGCQGHCWEVSPSADFTLAAWSANSSWTKRILGSSRFLRRQEPMHWQRICPALKPKDLRSAPTSTCPSPLPPQVEQRMFEAVHDVTARGISCFAASPRHEW